MLEEVTVDCPCCGEPFTALIDPSPGGQQYIEDCEICCRPLVFTVEVDADGALAGVSVDAA